MDKVSGLVVLSMINWCFLMIEAQPASCQIGKYYCTKYSTVCAKYGYNTNIVEVVYVSCGPVEGTACELANGPHCEGSRGFTQGYIPTKGARDCDLQGWRRRALAQTNKLRARHGVEPLVEDPIIQRTSQPFAEKVLRNGFQDHNPDLFNLGYGENYHEGSAHLTPESHVQWWYDENVNWNYKSSTGYGETGHFTQLVWKDTRKVGHGIAINRDCSYVVIIADYSPPGNIPGLYMQNVLPPIGPGVAVQPTGAPMGPFQPTYAPWPTFPPTNPPWRQGWPSQPNTPMSFGRRIGGSIKKGASIQLGKMCSGSSLLLFWLRAKGYMD